MGRLFEMEMGRLLGMGMLLLLLGLTLSSQKEYFLAGVVQALVTCLAMAASRCFLKRMDGKERLK